MIANYCDVIFRIHADNGSVFIRRTGLEFNGEDFVEVERKIRIPLDDVDGVIAAIQEAADVLREGKR